MRRWTNIHCHRAVHEEDYDNVIYTGATWDFYVPSRRELVDQTDRTLRAQFARAWVPMTLCFRPQRAYPTKASCEAESSRNCQVVDVRYTAVQSVEFYDDAGTACFRFRDIDPSVPNLCCVCQE